MFSTVIRDGKEFAVEQKKKRELKNRIFKLKSLEKIVKKRLKPLGINQKVVQNMNSLLSKKYGIKPGEAEEKSLHSETYRERLDLHLLKKTQREHNRLVKYDRKVVIAQI